MDTGKYVVLTTVNREEDAERLANGLLERRLVACVNVIPKVVSYYWWEGKIQADGEFLLVLKTGGECLEELKSVIPELHPYEVPELIALPIADGATPYLDWISPETARKDRT